MVLKRCNNYSIHHKSEWSLNYHGPLDRGRVNAFLEGFSHNSNALHDHIYC